MMFTTDYADLSDFADGEAKSLASSAYIATDLFNNAHRGGHEKVHSNWIFSRDE